MVMGLLDLEQRYGIELLQLRQYGVGRCPRRRRGDALPMGHLAAAWRTSFNTPFVAGTAALLLDVGAFGTDKGAAENSAAQAIAHAKYINGALGNGRLDIYQAVLAWRHALGM